MSKTQPYCTCAFSYPVIALHKDAPGVCGYCHLPQRTVYLQGAYQTHAASLGIAVDELTQAQKEQAAFNALCEAHASTECGYAILDTGLYVANAAWAAFLEEFYQACAAWYQYPRQFHPYDAYRKLYGDLIRTFTVIHIFDHAAELRTLAHQLDDLAKSRMRPHEPV